MRSFNCIKSVTQSRNDRELSQQHLIFLLILIVEGRQIVRARSDAAAH